MIRTLALAALSALLLSVAPPARADLVGEAWAASGDTLVIGETLVRLRGVDAAESDQTCTRADQRWDCGVDATATLEAAIAGRVVTCQDPEAVSSQTVSARCLADGADLAEFMARAGFAFGDEGADPAYRAAEAEAKEAGRGMWSSTFMTPERWRQVAGCSCAARKKAFMQNAQRDTAEVPTN